MSFQLFACLPELDIQITDLAIVVSADGGLALSMHLTISTNGGRPKEHLTLDNIGLHDIIIDHQFNQFAIRGQQQLSRSFPFHCCSHMSCV